MAASIGGKKSAKMQAETRRSKNEILFAQLCEAHFKNVVCNQALFNGWDADVILLDEKIAVLWNGRWHYEQIAKGHSIAQVQNRDKIKVAEIERAGFTPYIIKDMGRHDPDFVQKEFEKFIAGE